MLDPVAAEKVEAELDRIVERRARERRDADRLEDRQGFAGEAS